MYSGNHQPWRVKQANEELICVAGARVGTSRANSATNPSAAASVTREIIAPDQAKATITRYSVAVDVANAAASDHGNRNARSSMVPGSSNPATSNASRSGISRVAGRDMRGLLVRGRGLAGLLGLQPQLSAGGIDRMPFFPAECH